MIRQWVMPELVGAGFVTGYLTGREVGLGAQFRVYLQQSRLCVRVGHLSRQRQALVKIACRRVPPFRAETSEGPHPQPLRQHGPNLLTPGALKPTLHGIGGKVHLSTQTIDENRHRRPTTPSGTERGPCLYGGLSEICIEEDQHLLRIELGLGRERLDVRRARHDPQLVGLIVSSGKQLLAVLDRDAFVL